MYDSGVLVVSSASLIVFHMAGLGLMSLFNGLNACNRLYVMVADEEGESVGEFQCFVLYGL